MIRVTENYRQGSALRRTLRGWEAQRTFIVTGVSTQQDALVAADQTGTGLSIPQINDSHPQSAALRVFSVSASGGPAAWTVVASYSTPERGGQWTTTPEDPLAKVPVVMISTAYEQEEVDLTPEGWAIVNSALDPLRPAPTRPVRYKMIQVRRNEPFYDTAKAAAFEGTVNEDLVVFGTYRFPPGTLRLVSYELAEPTQIDAPFVPVVYQFEARHPDRLGVSAFDLRIRNVGNTGWYSRDGTPTKGRLITADGVPLSDVDLDERGIPLDEGVRVEGVDGKPETPVAAPNVPWYRPEQVIRGSPNQDGRPPTFNVWRNAIRRPFAGLL